MGIIKRTPCKNCGKTWLLEKIKNGEVIGHVCAQCGNPREKYPHRDGIKKLFEPIIPTEPVIVKPLVDYDVD